METRGAFSVFGLLAARYALGMAPRAAGREVPPRGRQSPPRSPRGLGRSLPFELPRPQATTLFLVALGLRLAHVLASRESPYFDHPIIDALTYHQAAASIAIGRGHPDVVFWQPPGYSYFLAGIYLLARSADLLAPRIVQAALGALSAVLTAWIGARVFGRRVGLIAGYVVAAYGTLIYFDGEILSTSLTVVLQLAAVAFAIKAGDSKRAEHTWILAGLLSGAASLVTATSLVFTAVFAVAARRRAAVVLLGAALAIAPATIRNAARGHEFVPISSNGGINFFIGNNPEYDRTVGIRPDRFWTEFTREPFREGIRSQGGASRYWADRSIRWIAKEPGAFLGLQLKKLRLFLGGDEIFRNQAIYPAREHSPVLAALLWKVPGLAFPFGLLLPFAMWGLVVAGRRAPLLAAIVLLYTAGVVAFFIAARYRVPLVPYLAIFAVQGMAWFAGRAGATASATAVAPAPTAPVLAAPAPWRHRVAGAAVVGAFLLVCNASQGRMAKEMNADAEFNLGDQLRQEGRWSEARRHYQNAIRQRDDYLEAWVNSGILEITLGNAAAGERALEKALSIDPIDLTALVNLAALRERQHRWNDAADLYARASAADPSDGYPARRLGELKEKGFLAER